MKTTTTCFLLALLLFAGTACRSTETEIVYARTIQPSSSTDGFMRIATEDEIPVTVDGHETAFELRALSGFLVVAEEDLVRLVENTARLRELRRGAAALEIDLTKIEDAGRHDE